LLQKLGEEMGGDDSEDESEDESYDGNESGSGAEGSGSSSDSDGSGSDDDNGSDNNGSGDDKKVKKEKSSKRSREKEDKSDEVCDIYYIINKSFIYMYIFSLKWKKSSRQKMVNRNTVKKIPMSLIPRESHLIPLHLHQSPISVPKKIRMLLRMLVVHIRTLWKRFTYYYILLVIKLFM
jgi:hypothetical protein